MKSKPLYIVLALLVIGLSAVGTYLFLEEGKRESYLSQGQADSDDLDYVDSSAETATQLEVEGNDDSETEPEPEPHFVANLADIAKANTQAFPVTHRVINGKEWIHTELEDYLVLHSQEPPLRGADVKGVQKVLKQLKFFAGQIDGIYGPQTVLAVQAMQKAYGLEPTGIVDFDDYDLLADLYEQTVPALSKAKPTGKVKILIVLDERTLYVLEDEKIFYKFPIAIGTVDTPSPIGSWKIVSKDSWSGGFGSRWLGLNVPYGRYGIHGTNQPWSIGGAESHGCLRMFNRDVEVLYEWVTWGTPVYVIGGTFPYNLPWRTLKDGDRGSDVWSVQNRLKELGYYKWKPDGVFGWATGAMIRKFQKEHKLPETGQVDWATRQKLGLYLFQ